LNSADIVVVLNEPLTADGGEDDCCAYASILLQIPKSNTPARTENTEKVKRVSFILNYTDAMYL
jgi:hypothetical protein